MSALTTALGEVRNVVGVLRDERDESPVGHLLVSGMLAEQLARLLAHGAQPGAVVTGDTSWLPGSAAIVHVIAGDPSTEDEDLVRRADTSDIPVVLVQLWPQERWTRPFLLSPFVVECSAGAGFPVPEITAEIARAVERSAVLARRVPVLKRSVAGRAVGAAAVRAAALGVIGARSRAARPLITLEQVRMLAELRNLDAAEDDREALAVLGSLAAFAVAAGFVFRAVARQAQHALPGPLANATVAAAGTWILGETLRRFGDRLP